MDLYELEFGKIILLREDLAEVIIDDGIEMDVPMVDSYHRFLLSHLEAPFSLLINKINSYTYSFEAQRQIATVPQINAMAVVAYNRMTEQTTQALINFPRNVHWNIEVFNDRDSAILWLKKEQERTALPQ